MSSDIECLISANNDSSISSLQNFVQNASKTFVFPELNEGTKRRDLWKSIFNIARTTQDINVAKNCLVAIRILSREKHCLNELINDEWLQLIKQHSGWGNKDFVFNNDNKELCLEAQKSLCNIVYNSRNASKLCCSNGIFEGIKARIQNYSDEMIPEEVKFFDVKLFFLLTALCPDVREGVKGMLDLFIEILASVLRDTAENHLHHEDLPPIYLTEKQADLVCELLKALFNITVRTNESDVQAISSCFTLMEILRNYLLISSNNLDKTWMLRNNVINLLTNMPGETFKALLIPIQEGHKVPKNLEFEGQNMTAIYEILMFLKAKFNDEPKISTQHEMLSPVVTVLLKGATSNRSIRKFLRIHILPPLKDVHTRPEQGTTIRNHLCRLLTTPITQLRDLAAELLFVLCKKNVLRMIKYTGYGNAAGLFAQRGLLAGGHDEGETEYSSDSGDSETEEYADHKHGINPVIGCYEEPHINIMQSMTEEQKEFEAMKLVELMDSLMKCGTIKPCRIGEDGKPQPIEHVLQLQEGLKAQQIHNKTEND